MAQLQVTIIEGRNLKKKHRFSENDPFVKIYLDDKKQKKKTKVKHNSNNPEWNQTLIFNHLKGQDILHIDVYDKDPLRNDKIGSIQIDLRDLYEKRRIEDWYNLSYKFRSLDYGEIHLILDYQPLIV